MHHPVHTSEYPVAPTPSALDVREIALLDLVRRPGSRPTEYWSVRHILEVIGEDLVGR